MSGKSSLLDQLSFLSNPTPVDLDPEEAYSSLSSSKQAKAQQAEDDDEDESEEDDAAGRGHYVNVDASKMRREADQRLREAEDLEKYGGVRASRKELYGGGSASEDEDASGDDDVSDDGEVPAGEDEDEEDEDMPFGQAENDDSSSSDEDAPFTPAAKSSAPTSNQTLEASQVLSSLRQSRSEDISKGLAVKRQLEFFENVLLVRMKLQKAVAGLGVLNSPEAKEELSSPPEETQEAVEACASELQKLSEGLFELRAALLKASEPSAELPAPKRRKLSPLAASSSSTYTQDATHDALTLSDAAHPQLVSTLSKWSTKILAAQGLTNLNRGEKFKSVKLGALEQIAASLEGLEGRRKVQRFKGESGALAATSSSGDAKKGVYGDDKEFYQSLVRDIIDRRGGTSTTADGPTHSNLGPKVRKAALDTRASKGRKLRYTPQDKIMNFMAPYKPEGAWHEEQVDELFGSLLGQRVQLEDEFMEVEEESPAMDAGLGGLRVF